MQKKSFKPLSFFSVLKQLHLMTQNKRFFDYMTLTEVNLLVLLNRISAQIQRVTYSMTTVIQFIEFHQAQTVFKTDRFRDFFTRTHINIMIQKLSLIIK